MARASWFVDGLSDPEAAVVVAVKSLEMKDGGLGSRILSQRWIEDDVSELEAGLVEPIRSLMIADEALGLELGYMRWLADGVSAAEAEAAYLMDDLADSSREATLSLMRMPFMDEVGPSDVAALRSLEMMASEYPEAFGALFDIWQLPCPPSARSAGLRN